MIFGACGEQADSLGSYLFTHTIYTTQPHYIRILNESNLDHFRQGDSRRFHISYLHAVI